MTMVNDWSVRDWTRKSIEEVIYQYYKHRGPKTYPVIGDQWFRGFYFRIGAYEGYNETSNFGLSYIPENTWHMQGVSSVADVNVNECLYGDWFPMYIIPNFSLDIGGDCKLSEADYLEIGDTDYFKAERRSVTLTGNLYEGIGDNPTQSVTIDAVVIYVNSQYVSVQHSSDRDSFIVNIPNWQKREPYFPKTGWTRTDGIVRFNCNNLITTQFSKMSLNATLQYDVLNGVPLVGTAHETWDIVKLTVGRLSGIDYGVVPALPLNGVEPVGNLIWGSVSTSYGGGIEVYLNNRNSAFTDAVVTVDNPSSGVYGETQQYTVTATRYGCSRIQSSDFTLVGYVNGEYGQERQGLIPGIISNVPYAFPYLKGEGTHTLVRGTVDYTRQT